MKIIFTTLALCVALSSYAQLERRKFFVTGSLSYSKSNYDNQAGTTVAQGVLINGGYMLTDNFAIGASGQFSDYWSQGKDIQTSVVNYKRKTRSYGGSIFARRFLSANDKLHFFIEGQLAYSHDFEYQRSGSITNDSTVSHRMAAAISPGVLFFVTRRIAVTSAFGQLSYGRIIQPANEVKYFDFDANFNIRNFTFGASIFF